MVETSICIIIGSAIGDIFLPVVSGFFGASEAWPQSTAVESPDCAQQRSPPASVSLIKQGRPDLLMQASSSVDMHEMSITEQQLRKSHLRESATSVEELVPARVNFLKVAA